MVRLPLLEFVNHFHHSTYICLKAYNRATSFLSIRDSAKVGDQWLSGHPDSKFGDQSYPVPMVVAPMVYTGKIGSQVASGIGTACLKTLKYLSRCIAVMIAAVITGVIR